MHSFIGVFSLSMFRDEQFGIFQYTTKTTENAEKGDLNQQMGCEASICWSRYTFVLIYLDR